MAGSSDDGGGPEQAPEGQASSTGQGAADDAETKGTVRTICSSEQKRMDQEKSAEALRQGQTFQTSAEREEYSGLLWTMH